MVRRKFRVNLFDLIVLTAIIVTTCIVAVSYGSKPPLGSRAVLVDIKISDVTLIKAVLPRVKVANEVYYNGTKYPVKQVSYKVENDEYNQIEYLYITLRGPGDIADSRSIFNGQRVYVHQKAEIHADYQVQGYVVDFRYAD